MTDFLSIGMDQAKFYILKGATSVAYPTASNGTLPTMPALTVLDPVTRSSRVTWYAAPGGDPDWLEVHFKTLNFTSSDVQQDDTTSADFGTDGALWQSRIKTALGGTFTVESVRRSNPTSTTLADTDAAHARRDPAQYELEKLDRAMGHASKGWFRLVLLDEGWMWDFKGIVKSTPFGGGLTDVMTFRAEVTIAGAPVFIRAGQLVRP
jgi:hypothetical protein